MHALTHSQTYSPAHFWGWISSVEMHQNGTEIPNGTSQQENSRHTKRRTDTQHKSKRSACPLLPTCIAMKNEARLVRSRQSLQLKRRYPVCCPAMWNCWDTFEVRWWLGRVRGAYKRPDEVPYCRSLSATNVHRPSMVRAYPSLCIDTKELAKRRRDTPETHVFWHCDFQTHSYQVSEGTLDRNVGANGTCAQRITQETHILGALCISNTPILVIRTHGCKHFWCRCMCIRRAVPQTYTFLALCISNTPIPGIQTHIFAPKKSKHLNTHICVRKCAVSPEY